MKQHLLENGLKAVADYYLGCSKHVQASYERACRVVRKFYGEFGFEEYNPAHDDEIMNQVLAGRTLTPESSYMFCRYVFRVLEMMKDYFAGRPFRKKYPMFSRYKFELEPEYLNFTNEFRDWLKLEPQTILGLYSIARDFAYYLQQNGLHDFSAIDQETLYSFMTWEYETHPATLDRVGYCLRLICQFLNQKGFNDVPTQILPFAFPTPRKKMSIEEVLSSPSVSHRDAAIFFLGLTTGMRAVDVVDLRLANIDWDNETIFFQQSKTGNAVCLPLTVDIGNSIYRYILEERPRVDDDHVFLRSQAPFIPLGGHSTCYYIVSNILQRAGIQKDGRIWGMCMLRHNAASMMVQNSIPLTTIAAILGHAETRTTDIYITADISNLKECVLPLAGISRKVNT